MDAKTYLIDEWTALTHRVGISGSDAVTNQVLDCYSEKHRVFHTPEHLRQVVALLEDVGADDRLILAAWFHDAVYVPGRSDNEAKSADLARRSLQRLGYPVPSIDFVCTAILATASHSSPQVAFDALLDADLSVLGGAPEAYAEYRRAIRAEYAELADDVFLAGRKAFISAVLERPAIYRTKVCNGRFEAAARRNLKAELDLLEAQSTRI